MFTKTQTVDSILSTFTKAADDLAALVSKKRSEISDNRIKIGLLEAENTFNQTEIERAESAAAKIKALTA